MAKRPKRSVKERNEAKEQKFYAKQHQFLDEAEEHEESSEEYREAIVKGKRDADVYTQEGRAQEMEDDEIEPFEQAFMEGEQKAIHYEVKEDTLLEDETVLPKTQEEEQKKSKKRKKKK